MTKREKRDIYQEVTDRVVAAIESGIEPWKKPWKNIGSDFPINVRNGRRYRGVNVILLSIESMIRGFSDPRWGTFKAMKEAAVAQARAEGRKIIAREVPSKRGKRTIYLEVIDGEDVPFLGGVRKGETGTRIILWKPVRGREEENEDGKLKRRQYLLLKDYVVFNVEQCDGIAALPLPEGAQEFSPLEEAAAIVDGFVGAPEITHGGNRASYSPMFDRVRMPVPEAFESPEAYYSTAYHELVHSTGHEKRLGRVKDWTTFGSDPYAKEELVAELGASMLAGIVGIANLDQSAAYVGHWLGELKNDKKLIVHAAAQAQKAADRILGSDVEETAIEETTDEADAALASAAA